jgi:hypothetical protein
MSPPVMARASRSGKASGVHAKAGTLEFGEDGGVVLVVYGGAVVGEREQRDDLDAGAGHGRDAGEHLLASQLA